MSVSTSATIFAPCNDISITRHSRPDWSPSNAVAGQRFSAPQMNELASRRRLASILRVGIQLKRQQKAIAFVVVKG